MKRYELLKNDTIQIGTHTLYRIRACNGFSNIKAGDLGGFIEKEDNLSHEGLCWVSDNACVYDNARIFGNAYVSGNACVYDNAFVFGNACILSNARIYGNTYVYGNAYVSDNACIFGNACVYGSTRISKNAFIKSYDDYFTVSNVGSRNDVATFYKGIDRNIYVDNVLFRGTIDEFIKQANEKHGDNRDGQVYRKAVELARLQLNFEED